MFCWIAVEVACLFLNSLCILRKVSITKRDLSKITPAALVKSLSVTGDFLELLQEFNKNSFEGLFLWLVLP